MTTDEQKPDLNSTKSTCIADLKTALDRRRLTQVRLDLGSGIEAVNDTFIGVDVLNDARVDVRADALVLLKALEENSVSEIYTSHFLEHHENYAQILQEISRVLKSGAKLTIIVPHFSNPWFYSDPTHKHFFGLYTLAYFFESQQFHRRLPSYVRLKNMRIEQIRLRFTGDQSNSLKAKFLRRIERFFNKNPSRLEIYEKYFSSILPCYDIFIIAYKTD